MNVEIDVISQSDFLIQTSEKKSLGRFADRKISVYRKQRGVLFIFEIKQNVLLF